MADPTPSTEARCANCGALRPALYCGECGQHERGSRRLRARDVAANCMEVLLDVESPLPATLVGLARNPGQVCLDYVNGRRKRYINPFAFLLVAVTAEIVFSSLFHWMGWIVQQPDDPSLPADDALKVILFASIVPVAFLWTKLFATSGRNVVENYVLGLYVLGLLAWLELALLPLGAFAIGQLLQEIILPIAWLGAITWAGTVFFAMPWHAVFWRMLVSSVVAFVAFGGLVLGLMEAVALVNPAEIQK